MNDCVCSLLQSPGGSIGMSISGGIQTDRDMPVFVSAVKPGSPVDTCGKIQVRTHIHTCYDPIIICALLDRSIDISQLLISDSLGLK